MKLKIFIFTILLSLNLSLARAEEPLEEGRLAKTAYNSDATSLAQMKEKDKAVAIFACVGCHNGKATYSVMSKEDDGFKLRYYGSTNSKVFDLNREFSLEEGDALELMAILNKEISVAKEKSSHEEDGDAGSSFEYAIKDGDDWKVAGHYSKGAYPLALKLAGIIGVKKQEDIAVKMKQIRAVK